MIEILEVITRKSQKEFVDFPLNLYKDNPYFVPPLYDDEMNIFNKKNIYLDTCDQICYLAKKEGKVVGRIQGIIQHLSNEKEGEKKARFTRFDSINDENVAHALFDAVEGWAKEKGVTCVHGPLGYSDLEREGLLIWGFNELSTFEEQYNYEYYQKLIEDCGYQKDVDWLEYKIYPPKEVDERIIKIADRVLERNKLHLCVGKNKNKFIEKYKDGIFETLDEAYAPLYGTIPFTEKMKQQLISQFKLIISLDYVIVVADENEKVVAFGLGFPSMSKAVQQCKGKLFPTGIFKILNAVKNPKILDLGLIAVRPEYQNKGVNSIILKQMMSFLVNNKIEYCETNLELETNDKVQQQWKFFETEHHKRRRAFIKHLK